jgi:hypothetical protein
MVDPELQDNEQILTRTQKVHVKSFLFETILTNKRILLFDTSKNPQPPKEIPLSTIQSVEEGENAIRELVITLRILTTTGRTRLIVLTFFREGGGNRRKERDEWIRQIRAPPMSSSDPVIRKVIVGKKTLRGGQDKVIKNIPAAIGSSVPPDRQAVFSRPGKKIMENLSESSQASQPEHETILGAYCTRCGTRVPVGSRFCNMCGIQIVRAVKVHQDQVSVPDPAAPVFLASDKSPINVNTRFKEPSSGKSSQSIPLDTRRTNLAESEISQHSSPAQFSTTPIITQKPAAVEMSSAVSPAKKQFESKTISQKNAIPPPLVPLSRSAAFPHPKKPKNKKMIVLAAGLIVIVIVAVVAGSVVIPNMSVSRSHTSNGTAAATSTTSVGGTTKPTMNTSSTAVRSPRQWSPFPDRT